jgi:hypothetical protein
MTEKEDLIFGTLLFISWITSYFAFESGICTMILISVLWLNITLCR